MPFTTTFASLSSKGFSSDQPVAVDYVLEDTQTLTTPSWIDIAGDTGGAVILSDQPSGELYIEGMAGNTLPTFSSATPFSVATNESRIDKNGTYAISGPLSTVGVASIYYAATANNWSLQTTISPVGTSYNNFGDNVNINENGDTVAVFGTTTTNIFNLEISSRTGVSTWAYDQTLTDGVVGSAFGIKSDFNTAGDALIVGAYGIDGTYTDEGQAYIYELSGGTWSLTATLQSPDTPTINNWGFGSYVCMNTTGDSVIISTSQGMASYRFQKVGATWVHTASFYPTDTLTGQTLGPLGGGIMDADKNNHSVIIMNGQVPSVSGGYAKGRLVIGQLGSGTYFQTQTLATTVIPGGNFLGIGGISLTNDGNKFVTTDFVDKIYLYAKA